MLNHTMLTTEVLKSMRGAVGVAIGHSFPSAIDDCVNCAVVKVLEGLATFDVGRGDFKGWASVIARNEARNWAKRRHNHAHDSEGGSDEHGDADEDGDADTLVDSLIGDDGRAEATRTEEAQWLAMALATLSDDERAFILAINGGMGQTEAGANVGWSPATSTRRRKAIAEKLAALR